MRKFIISALIILVCLFMFSCAADDAIIEINFDDMTAPVYFNQTTALQDTYLFLGVHFYGNGINGGAVLNYESNFGVTGESRPNFLAFSTGNVLQNAGTPEGPETILFTNTVSEISLKAGDSSANYITVTAYDAEDNEIDTETIQAEEEMTTMTLEGTGIKYVVISFTGTLMVIDDIIAIEE